MRFAAHSGDPYQDPPPGRGNEDEIAQLSPRAKLLLQMLTSRGLRFGREDSFKLYQQGLLGERILLGTPAGDLGCDQLLKMSTELGMPPCYEPLLREQFANANLVFFGLEDREDGGVFKVYLEFWDQLKQRVRTTGSREPGLLNVGVKWDTRSGAHCRTDYVCFPLLSVGDILGRLDGLYRDQPGRPSRDFSVSLIHQAADRNPAAAFLYVEVGEGGSPRKSFDINLYKASLTVSDIRPELTLLGQRYGIDGFGLEQLLGRVGGRYLGHLSGGVDRHGRDFATIYYEVTMLSA